MSNEIPLRVKRIFFCQINEFPNYNNYNYGI